jgi:Zn-dependent protease with chaperone function
MTLLVYLPLLLPALVSLLARRASERVPPAAAVRGLVAAALTTAALSVWSLVLLALTLFDDLPPWRQFGVRPALHLPTPVPDAVAAGALGALGWAVVRLVRDLRHRADTVRRLRATGPADEGLVVVDWDSPLAVAVPGRPGHPGHVLVTSGMLRLLGPQERRAVLAHERAHLSHHHHFAVGAVAAAAAVNPLLVPSRGAVTYLVERWADEEAAAVVDDRGLVARAVARAALATAAQPSAAALGVHGGVIVRRVSALRRPPAAATGGLVLLAAALAAITVCLLAGGDATTDFVEVFQAWPR